jgi:hypothetical protein
MKHTPKLFSIIVDRTNPSLRGRLVSRDGKKNYAIVTAEGKRRWIFKKDAVSSQKLHLEKGW